MSVSVNFDFLEVHDVRLVQLGALAERYFHDDPNTAIIKLRQLAEQICKTVAARHALYRGERETFEETLRRLSFERITPREISDVFHALRKIGNSAVHDGVGTHADALSALKWARQLGVWFHRTYGKDLRFKPGPFITPTRPAAPPAALTELPPVVDFQELERKLAQTLEAMETARREAGEHARARETAEDQLRREAEERALWEQLAQEAEAEKSKLRAHYSEQLRPALSQAAPILNFDDSAELEAIQASAEQASKTDLAELVARGEEAASKLDLDEAATRALIDQQLRDVRRRNGSDASQGRLTKQWPSRRKVELAPTFVWGRATIIPDTPGDIRRRNLGTERQPKRSPSPAHWIILPKRVRAIATSTPGSIRAVVWQAAVQ